MTATLPVETQRTWGHGGTVQNQIVKVPEYKLTIGNASADFKEIAATVPANGTVSSTRDGRLGVRRVLKILCHLQGPSPLFL